MQSTQSQSHTKTMQSTQSQSHAKTTQPMDITQLTDAIDKTNKNIKKIKKPLSAYQYYTKTMRELWNDMSEDDRDTFLMMAKKDNARYNEEKQEKQQKLKDIIKKQKIYLRWNTARVPCVGLDNGFSRYTIRGPVTDIELFTEKEKQKLINRGLTENQIGKYKSVDGYAFNWRAAKKWSVKVYGGSTNYQPGWGSLLENYEGEAGNFTTYNNYKGESWTENY